MQSTNTSLTLQEHHYSDLQARLFKDGKEAVAFLVCSKTIGLNRTRLLSKEVFFLTDEACRVRKANKVTWSTEAIIPLLDKAEEEGLSLVKIHCHPCGTPNFSTLDDESDRTLFPSIIDWVDHDFPHASVVMLPDGSMFGRTIDKQGAFSALYSVNVANDDLLHWFNIEENTSVPSSAKRIAQAFGDGTYQVMSKLRVGIVGCSGTGAPLITALNLNHIGEMVIVDPDVIEHGNRNRIATATSEDADKAISKVVNQKQAIEGRGLGTVVHAYQADICHSEVVTALGSCDLIFGCVDSVIGRHILNKISSNYLIPYFDLGVRIDADGEGGVDAVNASMMFIKPAGASLLSQGVYTPEQLKAEFMLVDDPEEYRRQLKDGYVKGVNVERPAVGSINGLLSNMVAEEVTARLHGYRYEDSKNFAVRRILFDEGEIWNEEADDMVCPEFIKIVARGDKTPLLNMHFLGA